MNVDLGGLIITPLSNQPVDGTEEMMIDSELTSDKPTTSTTLLSS